MKTCPHCHIQVGGSAQYCPLCQNPLVGTPEPDRYPKVVPPARQTSLFYRIAAFVLLGAAVICGVVDYIMIEGRHMHWSLLVLIGAVGVLLLLRALLRQGRNAPKLLFQILIGTSLIVTFADYYAGWNGIAIDAIVQRYPGAELHFCLCQPPLYRERPGLPAAEHCGGRGAVYRLNAAPQRAPANGLGHLPGHQHDHLFGAGHLQGPQPAGRV